MNCNGQAYSTFMLLIAVLVAVAILAILIPIVMHSLGMTKEEEKPSNEYWEEEWTCTKEIETGNLVNCREEEQRETEMIIRGDINKDIYVPPDIPSCNELGEGWETNFPFGLVCDHWDVNAWQCTIMCEKIWQELECDREVKCVEQKPRRCLIVREQGYINDYPSGKFRETRKCD